MTAPQDVTPLDAHPAKFSEGIVESLGRHLRQYVTPGSVVVDPFAGIGGIHVFAPEYDTRGVELEPEWANCHHRTTIGTALALPFATESVDAIATSPCYGNRFADTYLGQNDTCRTCGGDGLVHGSDWMSKPCTICVGDHYRRDCPDRTAELIDLPCHRCHGSGVRSSTRQGYAISLGRHPSDGSAAAMQWGAEYRTFHVSAWREAIRVLRPNGHIFVNMSDHIRGGKLQGVALWHASALCSLGMAFVTSEGIPTARFKHGSNRELRPQAEWLMTFRKPPE